MIGAHSGTSSVELLKVTFWLFFEHAPFLDQTLTQPGVQAQDDMVKTRLNYYDYPSV
jgi:hypothetical protein